MVRDKKIAKNTQKRSYFQSAFYRDYKNKFTYEIQIQSIGVSSSGKTCAEYNTEYTIFQGQKSTKNRLLGKAIFDVFRKALEKHFKTEKNVQ